MGGDEDDWGLLGGEMMDSEGEGGREGKWDFGILYIVLDYFIGRFHLNQPPYRLTTRSSLY